MLWCISCFRFFFLLVDLGGFELHVYILCVVLFVFNKQCCAILIIKWQMISVTNGPITVMINWDRLTTLCLRKVPTFKLSVTLLNLNRFFLNFCTARKRMKFASLQNSYDNSQLTWGMLLHYLGKLKIQISCRWGRNANKLHF